MMNDALKTTVILLAFTYVSGGQAQSLLTGVVEDVSAQTIEMPSLPGSWQRRIEWMAVEGSQVAVGDPVVRLDPGDLISQEEQTRTDLEKQQLSAARQVDELRLKILDAEKQVAETIAAVKLAELDAVIPQSTIPRLDFERYQLTLQTALRDRVRNEAELLNAQAELLDVESRVDLEVAQAQANYDRIRNALEATTIRASKAGFVIYGENPWTGQKIFPGDTLFGGFEIASVASRQDLQLRFWVHEADMRHFSPGQPLSITPDAQGLPSFDATVSWSSSQAVERQDWSAGGYFELIAKPVSQIPSQVMPGMSVMGVATKERQS
ncbi:MAG: HlyD family secretion protein [Lysobacterales bacterium]